MTPHDKSVPSALPSKKSAYRPEGTNYINIIQLLYVYNDLGSAYNSACWFLSLNEQPKVALPHCEDAVKHNPGSFVYRDSRGLAYALLGETGKATVDFDFKCGKNDRKISIPHTFGSVSH